MKPSNRVPLFCIGTSASAARTDIHGLVDAQMGHIAVSEESAAIVNAVGSRTAGVERQVPCFGPSQPTTSSRSGEWDNRVEYAKALVYIPERHRLWTC